MPFITLSLSVTNLSTQLVKRLKITLEEFERDKIVASDVFKQSFELFTFLSTPPCLCVKGQNNL